MSTAIAETKPAFNLTYTVRETAQLLVICPDAVYGAIRTGDLPSVRVGDRILVPAARLHQMLSATTTTRQPH